MFNILVKTASWDVSRPAQAEFALLYHSYLCKHTWNIEQLSQKEFSEQALLSTCMNNWGNCFFFLLNPQADYLFFNAYLGKFLVTCEDGIFIVIISA